MLLQKSMRLYTRIKEIEEAKQLKHYIDFFKNIENITKFI